MDHRTTTALAAPSTQAAVPVRPRTKIEDLHDEDRLGESRPSYKSWKKKYRKMRVVFDQQMRECEELHQLELNTMGMMKRIAIENDRILDLLLDNNNSPQIPPEKQIDLRLPLPGRSHVEGPVLPLDMNGTCDDARPPGAGHKKAYLQLLRDVPHTDFAQTCDATPFFAADQEPPEGHSHPLSFLTADDIDNYIYEIDCRIDREDMLPTLAPLAQPGSAAAAAASAAAAAAAPPPSSAALALPGGPAAPLGPAARDFALKNPLSMYNWLRKHAPHIFLQDGDTPPDEGEADVRKVRAAAHRADRGVGSAGKMPGRGKRTTLAASARNADGEDDMDYDYAATPVPAGRGKRKRDDDPGYRPKTSGVGGGGGGGSGGGGSGGGRPAKKKRQSPGAAIAAPVATGRRSKKDSSRDE